MLTAMTAAIYFSPDGYQTDGAKLMGRHAAGAGFLRAFAATETAAMVTGLVQNPGMSDAFNKQMRAVGYQGKVRVVAMGNHARLADPGTLYHPDPGLSRFAWQRESVGAGTYSLCGVTHTTASHLAMDAITQLLMAPLREWDALICTSRAVLDSVQTLLEAQADYLRWRFGSVRFPLPQLPVIPLGVHCGDFEFTSDQRLTARIHLGVAEADVVVLFLGRLAFHAKAHPQAMYLALERVAAKFPERCLHLVQCGWFANAGMERDFREGAEKLCATVTHHFLDGREAAARTLAWAAADIYVSLADNIQETFGLSPLEAMAAGLPVVVSDWDGYRDTVRDGIDGFRVPTLMPGAGAGEDLARRYETEVDRYDMYCFHVCELVAVDVAATTECLARLVADPALRRRMGDAGRRRVREVFDWRLILGRYRELWAELAQCRLASPELGIPFGRADFPGVGLSPLLQERERPAAASLARVGADRQRRPDRMDPFVLFGGYPSRHLEDRDSLDLVADNADAAVTSLAMRRALGFNVHAHHVYPSEEDCRSVLDWVAAMPGISVGDLIAGFPLARQHAIRRGLAWMIKMDVLKFPRQPSRHEGKAHVSMVLT